MRWLAALDDELAVEEPLSRSPQPPVASEFVGDDDDDGLARNDADDDSLLWPLVADVCRLEYFRPALAAASRRAGLVPAVASAEACVLMCLLRWSERMKGLLQIWHRKFFSPVWMRVCRWSSSERVNFLLQ